ncbi:hypothetical protein [Paenibacillus camerounensis]|uniref:hypothetical protein n=1 Tax=Paenibacillus camerounensis TaxID=1243663 RepID=UPI0005AA870D|nr:hypothetical protein [Paenibacillus camerounensis]
MKWLGHPCFGVGWTFAPGEDAPRTKRCYNRCALQIFFIPLSGENPETKANASAFPQSFLPLRCLSGIRIHIFQQKQKKTAFLVKWRYHPTIPKGAISLYIQYTLDQLCLPMDLEEDIPENHTSFVS